MTGVCPSCQQVRPDDQRVERFETFTREGGVVQVGGGLQILGWPSGMPGVGVPAHRVDPPVFAPQQTTAWRAITASGKHREDGLAGNSTWQRAPAGTCVPCRNGLVQHATRLQDSAREIARLIRVVEDHSKNQPRAPRHWRGPDQPNTAYLLYSWSMIPVLLGGYYVFWALTGSPGTALLLAVLAAVGGFVWLVHRRGARKAAEERAWREAQHALDVEHAARGRPAREALARAQTEHRELHKHGRSAAAVLKQGSELGSKRW